MTEEGGNGAADSAVEGAIAHPTESISHMLCRIRRYDSVRLWLRHGVITDEEFGAVDSLRLRLWREVEEKLTSDPSVAEKITGSVGSLPLHQACECTRAPLTAMQSLIRAYPSALIHRDNFGRTPLFSGCCLDADVFRELLHANPCACTQKDENGLLPHHFAAVNHGADLHNLWLLCEVYPDGAKTSGVRKNTPLHDLCHAVTNERLLALIAKCGELNDSPTLRGFWDGRALGEPVNHVVLLWARLHLLLMAAYHQTVPQIPSRDEIRARGNHLVMPHDLEGGGEGRTFSACHAAAGCGAPVLVSSAVMSVHRKMVKQTDQSGRLPLHLAAAHGHVARFYCDTCIQWKSERMYYQMLERELFVQKMCQDCFTFAYQFAEENDFQKDKPILFPHSGEPRHLDDGRLFCCLDIKSTERMERESTVEMLLSMHPQGAMHRDKNGYLPIHHAAESGDMDGCVLPLFQLNPSCLDAVTTSKRVPKSSFQLAVEAAHKSPTDGNIDVVFRLLQLSPGLLLTTTLLA